MKLAQEGADYNDRTLHHLLFNPTCDGGQWQMLTNLIEKYGLVPHSQWPSPYLADASRRLCIILNTQVSYCSLNLMTSSFWDNSLECEWASSIFGYKQIYTEWFITLF